MNSLETLTAFLGWCTILNVGMLALQGIVVMGMRDTLTRLHAKMFGVNEGDLPRLYFQYVAQYQMAMLVLNLAPYIALKIIG